MQAVVSAGVVVGDAGFKGAPDDSQVEIGYGILAAHRRMVTPPAPPISSSAGLPTIPLSPGSSR